MATRQILTPFSAEMPATNYPALTIVNVRPVLSFDASTAETCYFTFIAPQGLTGTLHLIVHYIMLSAITGSITFSCAVEAITPGDAVNLASATSFATANTASGAVPTTAGYEQAIDITLTNDDGIQPGDYVRLSLSRTSNTATGDCQVLAAEFRDAA